MEFRDATGEASNRIECCHNAFADLMPILVQDFISSILAATAAGIYHELGAVMSHLVKLVMLEIEAAFAKEPFPFG